MAAPSFSLVLAALGGEDNDARGRAEAHWFGMVKADVLKVRDEIRNVALPLSFCDSGAIAGFPGPRH